MKYFSDKSSLVIRAQLYLGLAMTYLPFLTSLPQPQPQPHCEDNRRMEADRRVTRLEMTRLTEETRRKVVRSSQPSLLHIAGCLLVLGLAVILSLSVLAVYIFSPVPAVLSQDSDLFNVLLVGGRGQDNSSLLTVELLNFGGCPGWARTDLLVPSLPLPLSQLAVSHLTATNSIAVCGADTEAAWRCFTLRNSSTTWETSLESLLARDDDEEEQEEGEARDLSQRHGASVLTLSDRLLLVGGRR